MSTCSTATSALRSPRRDDGHLETRLRDLERDWDAYKTSRRSGAPRRHHRRSRSATATPSSAVTAASPDDNLYAFLRCSPRSLVYSLQEDGGGGGGSSTDSAGAVTVVERGSGDQSRRREEDASSVCSVVEASWHSVSSASSCSSRPCHCAVLFRGDSTSSAAATEPSFSPAEGDVIVTEHARKTEDGRRMRGAKVGWFAAIALVVVGGVVAMAAVLVELGMGEDCAEFLVPT